MVSIYIYNGQLGSDVGYRGSKLTIVPHHTEGLCCGLQVRAMVIQELCIGVIFGAFDSVNLDHMSFRHTYRLLRFLHTGL